MSSYDFVLIVKDEGEGLKQIEKILTELDGKIEKQDKSEKRQFAYPIKKVISGFYHFWTINLPSDKISEFKKRLNVESNVLRYLLLVRN